MIPADMLPHVASLERYTGSGPGGAAYADAVPVPVYFEGGSELVEKPAGTEVGAVGKFWTNETNLPVGSRVTINGLTGYIDRALVFADGQGLDHVEVDVASVPRAAETRAATVSLSRPTAGGWDDDEEATSTGSAGDPYASNLAARITALITRASSDDLETAEETLTVAAYSVALDHDEEPFEGDLISVTACPDDPTLEGRTLQIIHVVRGSSRLERELLCNLNDAPPPTP